jgi:hypothetical protein
MDSKSPMKVKGTGALALQAFITSRYEDRFTAWLDAMPPASRAIYGNPILAFELYSVEDALILPTEAMCTLFYGGDEHGAWESGHFSAGYALNSFYKIFFRFGSPQFIIDRASRVFSTYYPEGELRVADKSENRCVLRLVKFREPHRVIEQNIAGWMDGALELMGKKDRDVAMTRRMTKGDAFTEYVATW